MSEELSLSMFIASGIGSMIGLLIGYWLHERAMRKVWREFGLKK